MTQGIFRVLLVLAIVSAGVTALCGHAAAADGAALFEQLTCTRCHKPDRKSAGAALSEIAEAYGRDQAKLVMFFKGKSKPVIESDKWGMMRQQLPKLEALADEDQLALAGYIMSFK
jgi:cytochrome c551/c552